MTLTKTIISNLAIPTLLAITALPSFAQTMTSPFDTYRKASWLKDADIALSKSSETVSFMLDNTEGRVSANRKVSEFAHPAKMGQTFFNRIHINDEVSVTDIDVRIKGKKKIAKSDLSVHDVTDDDIFYSDSKAVDYALKFDQLLDINNNYDLKFNDVRYMSLMFFTSVYPTAEKEIILEIPDWLDLDVKEFNFEGYKMSKKSVPNPKGGKTLTFTAKELAGYKNERKAPNAKKIFPHIMLLFKSFKKDGKTTKIFEKADDLYTWYSSICKDIGNSSAVLKPQVEKLTAGKKTDLEKIESIFYWVQDNIRYIAFENGIMGFRPDACQNVYKNLYGDCKGMANLLKQMLIIAGYDARLTWIGTNDIPYDYSTPCVAVDNHMICTVILNDKKYFLDGTEDYIALDDYATRIQGRPVLIENGKTPILDKVPAFTSDRNRVIQKIDMTLDDKILRGSVQSEYHGESKTRILYVYNHIPTDKRTEALKEFVGSDNPNISIKKVDISSTDDRKNAFKVRGEYELKNIVSTSGNEMYLALDLDKEFMNFDFDSTRVYDWEFSYPYKDETVTTFTLPAGYKVDYLPKPVVANLPYFKANLTIEQKDNKLIYTKKFTLDALVLKKKDFKDWNVFVKNIKEFYKDQVVLVKK
jgi:hypothetical protein